MHHHRARPPRSPAKSIWTRTSPGWCARRSALPGKAHLGLDLNVVPGPLPARRWSARWEEALGNLIPKPLPPTMSVSAAIGDDKHIAALP